MKTLSEFQLNALKEFIDAGTAHAAAALSELLDKKAIVNISKTKVVDVTKIPEHLGGEHLNIIGLYFKVSGDIKGNILLIFDEKQAGMLLNILLAGIDPGDTPEFDSMRKSALMELGNIMTNSYLNALAHMIDMKMLLSVPRYAADELASVIDFLLIELIAAVDQALLMDIIIKLPETEINGSFIIVPDTVSLEKIFNRAGQ
ncbi:MAG: chemotaxis protein CheC [Elusimicrobiota bacterium]